MACWGQSESQTVQTVQLLDTLRVAEVVPYLGLPPGPGNNPPTPHKNPGFPRARMGPIPGLLGPILRNSLFLCFWGGCYARPGAGHKLEPSMDNEPSETKDLDSFSTARPCARPIRPDIALAVRRAEHK